MNEIPTAAIVKAIRAPSANLHHNFCSKDIPNNTERCTCVYCGSVPLPLSPISLVCGHREFCIALPLPLLTQQNVCTQTTTNERTKMNKKFLVFAFYYYICRLWNLTRVLYDYSQWFQHCRRSSTMIFPACRWSLHSMHYLSCHLSLTHSLAVSGLRIACLH